MRSPFTLLAALLLAAAALPAAAGSPFTAVPAGTPVRVTGAGFPSPLRGTLMDAGDDSLRVLPARGGAPFTIANGAVRSLDYRSASRPCTRLNVLLGIGAGMAGGAVLGAALSGGGQEGGGSSAGGEDGGGDRAPAIVGAAAAAAVPAAATSSGSAEYRAIMGAVLGGLAGGLLCRLVPIAFHEDVWSTVPGPVSRALGVPSSPARSVFTVRLPLRRLHAGS